MQMASCYNFVNFPIFCVVAFFIIHIYMGRGYCINIFKSFLGCIDGVGMYKSIFCVFRVKKIRKIVN